MGLGSRNPLDVEGTTMSVTGGRIVASGKVERPV
jgi:hypothetical protein